ncbi:MULTISPECIES: LysR substrate-binding domain-containing protein [unclassified Devosia]|uniref:LysR substrate-binding domain-containing protein n=1 Tax=unclassified Devosia TaxID=196773 RepID=UPI001AC11E66|nr:MULTISPECIES: LysR substrate-binding domain-containing protein [unclassified Devosia]MBN9306989.1 LysR family transcriptional regulator [Devosia sp.]
MSLLSLRQIEMFRAVMICGSITGAANLMNLTQPGVSRTIAMLEGRLGYALFVRKGRRIIPTVEAEALYREVEKSYRSIEYVGQIAADIGLQRAGALRIATLPALAQWLVPQALGHFLSSRPKVSAFIESMSSRQIAELVSTRQFDVGIVEMPTFREAIQVRPLPPIPYVAVIPTIHRLAGQSLISLKDLHGERMVLLSQHSFVRHQIDSMLSGLGVVPQVVVETPSASIACGLAAAGIGITLVGWSTAKPTDGLGVSVKPLLEPFGVNLAVIFPEMDRASQLAAAFAEDLQAFVEGASRPGRNNPAC